MDTQVLPLQWARCLSSHFVVLSRSVKSDNSSTLCSYFHFDTLASIPFPLFCSLPWSPMIHNLQKFLSISSKEVSHYINAHFIGLICLARSSGASGVRARLEYQLKAFSGISINQVWLPAQRQGSLEGVSQREVSTRGGVVFQVVSGSRETPSRGRNSSCSRSPVLQGSTAGGSQNPANTWQPGCACWLLKRSSQFLGCCILPRGGTLPWVEWCSPKDMLIFENKLMGGKV